MWLWSGDMDVGGKHRDEKGDQSPSGGATQAREEETDAAGDLGRAGDEVGGFLERQPRGHHVEGDRGRGKVPIHRDHPR